jgi:hypothetical protein
MRDEIKAFMERYDVDDWDKAVEMYATYNVIPVDKVRAALGEAKIQEQDEPEDLGPEEGEGMEDLIPDKEDGGPEDEPMPEEDFLEGGEVEIPVPEDKEYVGKSDDTHFYMVPEKNDQGDIIDMKIVDQEENQLFSAEENGIEPTDMSLFLNTVFRDSDVGIAEIDRQVIVKYVIPAAEQEQVDDMEDEEEDLMGEDLPGGDEFAEEDGEDEFAEEEDLGPEPERKKRLKKKDELMRPMESRLTEKKVVFDGETFDVQLVDEGAESTVISVNGREFPYSPEFASMFHGQDGKLSESGLEELAMDALSTLEPSEFEALVQEGAEESEPVEEGAVKKLKEGYEYIDEDEAYERYNEMLDSEGPVTAGGVEFSPSRILKKMDPIAYDTGFNDWLDGEQLTVDPDEDEDEDEDEDVAPSKHYGGGHLKPGQVKVRDPRYNKESKEAGDMKAKESKVEEQGEFKHVYLVKYLKDDGEEAEMRVEALDDNDAKMMMLKRKGIDKVTDVKKVAESKEVDEALSRKYYIQFADMLKDMENREEARAMAAKMAEMFAADNPMFDRSRFMAAAEVDEEVTDEKCDKKHVEEDVGMDNMKAGTVLRDVAPYTWVRLSQHPDRIDKAGPTSFEVSHNGKGEVFSRDGHGSPSFRVSGDERSQKYLNTPVVADEDPGEASEGKDEPGKRDGTGPYKGSKGKRKMAGEKCPMEESKVVFAADDKRVKDGKEHFPMTSENLAIKAMERVMGYEKAPAWFDGELDALQEAVKTVVTEAYPSVKIEETKKEKKAPAKLDEATDPAFGLAQELLGLNESTDEMGAIEVGTKVHIMSKVGMRVMHESVMVAQVNERGVEVTGNEAEVDQEWYTFDTCHIYPV